MPDEPRTVHAPVRQSPADLGAARQDSAAPASPRWRSSAPASTWITGTRRRSPNSGHWFRDSDLQAAFAALAHVQRRDLGTLRSPRRDHHHRAGEGRSRLRMVDEIKRALEIAEVIPVPLPGPAPRRRRRRVRYAQGGCGVYRARSRSTCSRARAAWRFCWRIFPTIFSSAERLLQFEELTHVGLNYCFDTGHANMGGRTLSNRVQPDEGAHPLHPRARQQRARTTATCSRWSPRAAPSTGSTTMELLRSRAGQYPAAAGIEGTAGTPDAARDACATFSTASERTINDSTR